MENKGASAEWESQKSDSQGNLDEANLEPWGLEKQVNLHTQTSPDSQGSDFKTAFVIPPGHWPPFPSQFCLWLQATHSLSLILPFLIPNRGRKRLR